MKNRGVRILVVEDERKVARALQEGLEGESYSVSVAHTGEDGFFLLNAEQFDLLILDVMLPGRSGIQSPRRTRSRIEYWAWMPGPTTTW